MVRPSKAAADREATERVAAIMALSKDDTPTEPVDQRPTDLAPVNASAETAALVAVQAGMRMAETLRRQRQLVYESETWHSLASDLAAAERALSDDKLVPAEVISRILRQIEGWALQRRLNGNRDGET
jgi:hypothetical protein